VAKAAAKAAAMAAVATAAAGWGGSRCTGTARSQGSSS
jgi:hypothetical protein